MLSFRLLLCALLGLSVGFSAYADPVVLGDFDNDLSGWSFSNGGEYAGAKGHMERNEMNVHAGTGALELRSDFSDGGLYVSATYKLPTPVEATAVSFWVQAENLSKVVVRLGDSTGQTHQHFVTLESNQGWQQIRMTNLNSRTKWGGANDGKWHGPLKYVGLLLEKHQLVDKGQPAGVLRFDDVTVHTEEDMPAAAAGVYRIPAGDFETANESWWAHHGLGARQVLFRDDTVAKAGRHSLRIDATFDKGDWLTAMKQFDQPLNVRDVSLWVRGENLRRISVRVLSDSGQQVSRNFDLQPGGEWQQVTLQGLAPGNDPEKGRKLDLYGARASLAVSFSKKDVLQGNAAKLWLDDVQTVATGQGVLAIPGHTFWATADGTTRIDLERTLPFYWGEADKPGSVTVNFETQKAEGEKTPRVELLNHRLELVRVLSDGGAPVTKDQPYREDFRLELPQFGHYYVQTYVGKQPVRARVAWLKEAARPDPAGKLGVQTHFNQGPWGRTQHVDGTANAIELLAKMGAGWVRDDARYEADKSGRLKPEDGPDGFYYPWWKLSQVGIKTLMCYTDYSCAKGQPPHTDEQRKEFARRFAELIERYKDRTQIFEVWNEPNIPPGWRGRNPSAQEYAALLKEAYAAAKAVDPGVTVLGVTSCGTDFNYIADVVKHAGIDAMDAISAHPYHGVAPELFKANDTPNPVWMGDGDTVTFANRMKAIHRIAAEAGRPDMKVWGDEFGYGSKALRDEFRHGVWIMRQFMIAMSLDEVARLFCYTLIDQGYDEEEASHMTFGLIRSDGSPEPRYVMFNTLARMVHGKTFRSSADLGDAVVAMVFAGEGEPVAALWSLDVGKTVTLQASAPVRVVSLMGNERVIQPVGGRVSLGLTGEPVFLPGVGELTPARELVRLENKDRVTSEDAIVVGIRSDGLNAPRWMGRAPSGWTVQSRGNEVVFQPNPKVESGTYELVVQDAASGMSAASSVTLNNAIRVKVRPGLGPDLQMTVENPFPVQRELTLRPRSTMLKMEPRNVALIAADTTRLTLPLETRTAEGWVTVPVSLNPALPQGSAGTIQFAEGDEDFSVAGVTPCYRLAAASVDGRTDEWEGKLPCLLQFDHQARSVSKGAHNWKGKDDLSARFWMGWSSEGIVLSASVKDDEHVQPFPAPEMWKGDSLQLAFLAREARYEFTIGLGEGKPSVYQSSPRRGDVNGANVVVQDNGGEMVYEILVPWGALGITDRDQVRFAMVINDNDKLNRGHQQGGRKGYLEWFEGIGGAAGKQPDRYGAVQFE